MFISEHQRKTIVCRLCKITQIIFFLVIPKVYWTVCVFHFLNLESLKRIDASLFTWETSDTAVRWYSNVTLKRAKTVERNSTRWNWSIFHQLNVKNVNVNVVITIYCQHNSIFLGQKKNYGIHNLTGQNRGLSGLKNIWPVIMTGNLLSVIFSPAYTGRESPLVWNLSGSS